MEMRLGKTKVVIDWLRPLRAGKILVVAPLTTLRLSWQEEILLEGEPAPALLVGTSKERMEIFSEGRKWNLINYEGLLQCPNLLTDYRWDAIILDESTRIKNPKAQTTRALVLARANADKRCLLSGYPAPEGPLDYYEQFNFLHGGFLGFRNFWSYRNIAFFNPPGTYRWIPKPSFAARIKAYVQKHAFVLSRKDVGLANEKIYERRSVPMVPAQKKMMEKLEKEFVLELPSGEVKSTIWSPVKFIWMARLAGGYIDGKTWFEGKTEELLRLLQGELSGEQVLVWFRFNAELRHVQAHLDRVGIPTGAIDGTTPDEARSELRQAFRAGKIRVLLLQQKIGRFGLDLSTASTAIYYSNGYSLEDRVQSEDRIEHPTKKEPLLIIDLVTEGSVDEVASKLLGKKKAESDYYLRQEIAEATVRRVHARTAGDRSGNRKHRVGAVGPLRVRRAEAA